MTFSTPSSCAANCALEGARYGTDHGIFTSASELKVSVQTGNSIGNRVYVLEV